MSTNIKLVEIVEDAIEGKKTAKGEDVKLEEYDWHNVREIGYAVHDGKIETTEEVIEKLEKIEHLKEGLRKDFRDIEKEVKKVLKA